MKTKTLVFVCGALLVLPSLVSARLDGQPSKVKSRFTCGDVEVIAESTCLYIPNSIDKQCTRQTIRLVNPKKGHSEKLPHDGRVVKPRAIRNRAVLDAYVTAWDCLKSKTEVPYLLLWYTCNWGSGCVGTNREWQRLFTVDGAHLTAGFRKHNDLERLERLYQKLGLSYDDIQLKPVDY